MSNIRMRKGSSNIVSVIFTLILTLVSGILLYMWLPRIISIRESGDVKEQVLLKVDAVAVEGDSYVTAITVYLRNIGSCKATIAGAYIEKHGVAVCKCLLAKEVAIEPDEMKVVKLFPCKSLPPGTYTIKLVSSGSCSIAVNLALKRETLLAHKVTVSEDNTQDNKVTFEDEYAVYECWATLDSETGYYKIWFRIYAKPGVTIEYVYTELFDKDGEHPDWVGFNPWEWTTPYTYPDYAGAEWTPVKPEEMPITVILAIKPED